MLAIIIPYFKLTFFEFTLQSLALQTDKRFKVYIGDDASTENPFELLSKFQGIIDFEYYRFEENLGGISLVKQWERCINLIQDEKWIMILGDDDVLGENSVAEFYNNREEIEKENVNIIRLASCYIDASGKKLSEVYYFPKLEKATDSYYNHFLGLSRSSLSEHIFRKSVYDKYQFTDFPLAWHSDDKAWLDFTNCGRIYTINEAIVQIRLSESSISGNINNLELKRKSRYLFFKDIVFNKLINFNKLQKKTFLLEFGILAKEQNQLSFRNSAYVVFQLFKMGSLYALAKFIRRVFKAKF